MSSSQIIKDVSENRDKDSYKSFSFYNASEAYPSLVQVLFKEGTEIPSRLGRTLELPIVTNIRNPRQFVPFVWGRRFNYFGMLAESLWILSGVDEVGIIGNWNSRIGEFSDDEKVLYGAYGPRIVPYLGRAIQTLVDDESSRQVVIPIFRPDDVGVKTKDLPCNTQVAFKIRGGRLHMTVTNRSNDIHWGLAAINLPQFAMLQNAVASAINHYPARSEEATDISLGVQRHVSDSLHMYLDLDTHKQITKNMLYGNRGISQFDFYDILHDYYGGLGVESSPVSFHSPESNVWIPDINDDLVWQVYTAAINGGELRERAGAFMHVSKILLWTYIRVMSGEITRLQAIDNIHGSLYDLPNQLDEGDLYRNTPLDYIFGCLYTLVSQVKGSRRRDEYSVKAVLSFIEIAKRLCSVQISMGSDKDRLEKFLAYG